MASFPASQCDAKLSIARERACPREGGGNPFAEGIAPSPNGCPSRAMVSLCSPLLAGHDKACESYFNESWYETSRRARAVVRRLVRRSSKSEDGSLGEGGSIAGEVVGADGVAEIGPALRAPVIDEAGFAHERLVPLCLAHGRWRRPPEIFEGTVIPLLHRLLRPIEHAIWRRRIGIDEIQLRIEIRQLHGRIGLTRPRAQHLYRGVEGRSGGESRFGRNL